MKWDVKGAQRGLEKGREREIMEGWLHAGKRGICI